MTFDINQLTVLLTHFLTRYEYHKKKKNATKQPIHNDQQPLTFHYSIYKENISPDLRNTAESSIKNVRDALAGSDISHIRSTTTDLENTMQRIGQEISSHAGTTADPGTTASSDDSTSSRPSDSDQDNHANTVEGEYHEVK